MNKALIYGAAAAVGVGGGLALFSLMSDRPETTRSGPETELVEQAEVEPNPVGKTIERKPEPPERELRPHEEALKKQLEEGFGLHTRHAGPAWMGVAVNLGKAGLDVDSAKARAMSKTLSSQTRNADADAAAYMEQQRALISELRQGPAGAVVDQDLVRIEGMIEDFESAPSGDE
jgi:hypothetical protein